MNQMKAAHVKSIHERLGLTATKQQRRRLLRNMCAIPSPEAKRLEGKTVLVIGGATGIGETTARLMAAHGARVVIADVEDASATAADIGDLASYVACNVRKESEVAAAVDAAAAAGGGQLDIVHHNAGILGALGPIDETPVDEFDYTLAVNLRGALLGVKHAARHMKPRGRGSIVLTGSVASVVGGMGPHSYCVAKHGLVGLMRSASVELRAHGVRVNMVSPDAVSTLLMAHANAVFTDVDATMDNARAFVAQRSPLRGRYLTTLDIAQAVLYLASDEAAYVSGHNLVVDCGNTVTKPNDSAPWYKEHFPLIAHAGQRGMPST